MAFNNPCYILTIAIVLLFFIVALKFSIEYFCLFLGLAGQVLKVTLAIIEPPYVCQAFG